MMRIAMSEAASGLLRALLARAQVPRNRILLSDLRSVDWQSLTFIGERHQIGLRVPAPDAKAIVHGLITGIEEAEFKISGHLVADISLARPPIHNADDSISVEIEALTIAE